MGKKMIYFAYGSNLNLRQMKQRCPDARPIGVAKLPGHRLVFRGVADVIPNRQGGSVMGVIWEITPRCLKELDRYEGYPHLYGRRYCTVIGEDDGILREAIVYYMKKGDLAPPSRGYWKVIMEGYNDFCMVPRRDLLEPNYGYGNARLDYDCEKYYQSILHWY